MSNYFLANTYTNLNQWAFPSDTVIGAGNFLVVFADGQPQLSTGAVLHTSFRLNPTNASIALSRGPQILDYINCSNVPPHYSYGSSPDGQLVDRQLFFYPTPGASNNPALPPLTVVVNEWMAGNTMTMVDASTGKYEDWFELYNYGTNTADLSGYYLTTVLTNTTKFQIPAGYTIPPHSFLLVWADKKPSANQLQIDQGGRLDRSFCSRRNHD
ncbi:MAG: lamin tail domain-containing protein [Verrucomicrobia bacterium]|nr:lamin tail domain-containing protein [Verrucomicrobiota bacterium]